MAELFGRSWTRRQLRRRVGDVWQLGGVRNITLKDGNENEVRAVEFRTGSSFRFAVLPVR